MKAASFPHQKGYGSEHHGARELTLRASANGPHWRGSGPGSVSQSCLKAWPATAQIAQELATSSTLVAGALAGFSPRGAKAPPRPPPPPRKSARCSTISRRALKRLGKEGPHRIRFARRITTAARLTRWAFFTKQKYLSSCPRPQSGPPPRPISPL